MIAITEQTWKSLKQMSYKSRILRPQFTQPQENWTATDWQTNLSSGGTAEFETHSLVYCVHSFMTTLYTSSTATHITTLHILSYFFTKIQEI